MKEAHRVGITPYLLRVAAYYAAFGVGEYNPGVVGGFDRVGVRMLMPWQACDNPMESSQVLVVEFFLGKDIVRYVEFVMRVDGFGGEPLVTSVE